MKWIADNLLMPLSGILVIAIIVFAWKMHKSKKQSRQRNRMKKSMFVSIVTCFIVGIAAISMDPTENSSSSSDETDNTPQHKVVHHSNNWKIQHEMPAQIEKYWGNTTIHPSGFFDAKPYTLNVIANDQYPMKPQHEYTDVQQALKIMKNYNFNDFSDVSITIQGRLMDDQGDKTSYMPLEKYNFKGKNIMEIHDPLQMSFDDLKNLSNDYWQSSNLK